ncbi:TPA: hypothetical protein KDY96_004756, partial [Vibrio parahaemolyticus]|nr:hypothetical protein [Vibrio parahaemolyticus]
MKKLIVLISLICAGCSSSYSTSTVSVDPNGSECITPIPEVLIEHGVDVTLTTEEKNFGVKGKYDPSVERVRQEDQTMDKFERLTFNLCQNYIQGRLSKDEYNEQYKTLLDKFFPKVDNSYQEKINKVRFEKIKLENKVNLSLGKFSVNKRLDKDFKLTEEYVHVALYIDKLKIKIKSVDFYLGDQKVSINKIYPFDGKSSLSLTAGHDIDYPFMSVNDIYSFVKSRDLKFKEISSEPFISGTISIPSAL